tara:strand:- start:251 stop:589 length:339 start_codon:yes stop_codon:yes gene_type:complete
MKKLILIFIIIFSSRVYAQDIAYLHILDCGKFLSGCDEHLSHINCQAQTAWAQGYISGLNAAKYLGMSLAGKDVSHDTIKHSLIKYCRDNPLDDTGHAAHDIYLKLYFKALK